MADQKNFGCEACGKHYVWKPELAGKHVKCKCGNVMSVPGASAPVATKPHPPTAHQHAPAAAPPPPPPAPVALATKEQDETEDDLYDFAPEPDRLSSISRSFVLLWVGSSDPDNNDHKITTEAIRPGLSRPPSRA